MGLEGFRQSSGEIGTMTECSQSKIVPDMSCREVPCQIKHLSPMHDAVCGLSVVNRCLGNIRQRVSKRSSCEASTSRTTTEALHI